MRRLLKRLALPALLATLAAVLMLSASASAATLAPVLLTPTSGSTTTTPITVHYELPEAAATGSATLVFKQGASATPVVLASGEDTAGEHTISLQTHDLTANKGEVKSAAPNELADGTYELVLTYKNVALEPPASVTAKEVTLDTVTDTPTLTEPAPEETFEGTFAVSYELPEAPLSGSLLITLQGEETGTYTIVLANSEKGKGTVNINPSNPLLEPGIAAGPSKIVPGVYKVHLQYQDQVGNPIASTGTVKMTLLATKCSAGTYSETGRLPCKKATAGHFVEEVGATEQSACEPGTYNPLIGASLPSACVEAAKGHFVSSFAASAQEECLAGRYAEKTGSSICTPAAPGHYVPDNAASAQLPCPAGTFAAVTGSSICTIAPEGQYAPAEAINPIECLPGTSNPVKNGASASACIADPVGYYSGAGATSATPCAPGSFAPETSSIECRPAEAGFYVPGEHASSQLACPGGHFSPFAGASRCAVAPAGTYAPEGALAPIACPAGTEAPVEGLAACSAAVKGPSPTPTTSVPVTPQPTPVMQQPTLQCSVIAATKQLSLSRTAKQAYSLKCNLAASLSVRAVLTITAGHRHLRLTLPAATLEALAGATSSQNLRVKLTKAARSLLKKAGARVSLAISVYGVTSGGQAARLTSASLTGRR